jgi:hypothetical protein
MISDSKWQYQCITRRNALASMVRTLIVMRSGDKDTFERKGTYYSGMKNDRVEVGPWIGGFHVDLTGMTRKTEKAVLADLKVLAPNVSVEVSRKSKHYPRALSIAF